MATVGNHRFLPEHAVPLTAETISKSKTERIEFGTSDLVRVHTMGVIISRQEDECEAEYELSDDSSDTTLTVIKMFTPSFPKEQYKKISIGDFVNVFGKIRVSPRGSIFINAFMIRIASREEYRNFKLVCKLAEQFYDKRTSYLPGGSGTHYPTNYGLKNKAGSLNRFPIGLLEESSSSENNMGDWPDDLEKLSAGAPLINQPMDASVEQEQQEDDQNEDSFDAGPFQE